MARFFDIVIIGGGVVGSSAAFALTRADPRVKVAVVEPDPTYERASSTLSLANIRMQFSLEENIRISRYALEVLESIEQEAASGGEEPGIGFRREGNLFLVDEAGRDAALRDMERQNALGGGVEWWPPEKIQARYPLYAPAGPGGGTFGFRDGYCDAYALLMRYRAGARSRGAEYIEDRVTRVLKKSGRVAGVEIASGDRLSSPIVINAAGAWAAQVARTAGVPLPVDPVKRQVFVLDPAVKPKGPLPLTVLPSGMYFRTETGGTILLGRSMPEDPVGFDFRWDARRFHDTLWPELAGFVPAFDAHKLVRGWAGLYAVNRLDGNAILGEWPEVEGFFLANGFSGHGLQQAPAVGRHLAESILRRPLSLDLSVFQPERLLENRPICERGIV